MKKIYQISSILLRAMELFSIKLPLIKKNDPLLKIIIQNIKDQGKSLNEGDILVIAEKVVATSQGRVVSLSEVKNVDWTGGTYDLYHNGAFVETANMRTHTAWNSIVPRSSIIPP